MAEVEQADEAPVSTLSTDPNNDAATTPTSAAATQGTATPLGSPAPTSTAGTSPPTSSTDASRYEGCSASNSADSANAKVSGAPSGRPPTLSDIAARMKLDGADAPDSPSSNNHSSHLDVVAPLKGRLGLAGRLNSYSSDTASGQSESEGDAKQPTPVAFGVPPSTSKSSGQSQQQSDLASTEDKSSPNTSGKGKTLPTLEEIRERLNRKGQATTQTTPASSSGVTSAAAKVKTTEGSPVTSQTLSGAESTSQDRYISPSGAHGLGDASRQPGTSAAQKAEEKDGMPPPNASAMLPPASTKPLTKVSLASSKVNATLSVPATGRSAPGTHPLQHEWTLYFDSKEGGPSSVSSSPLGAATRAGNSPTKATSPSLESSAAPSGPSKGASNSETWEAALKKVGEYRTVESFMSVFGTIKRPSTLERNANYHLFKDGIKPMWEDPANARGGKWVLTFDRKLSNPALVDRSWIWLVLALIGEELDADDEVTGAVVSTRPKFDRIALWVRGKQDVKRVNEIGRKLIDLLQVESEPGVALEFSSNSTGSHSRSAHYGSQIFLGFSNGAVPPSGSSNDRQSTSATASATRGASALTAGSPPTRLGSGRSAAGFGSGGFGTGGLMGRTNASSVGGGGLLGRTQSGTKR
ncbi:translation initiation factor eIF4e [Microstroma glucosiphilum]|uniref:Translation initiation factor eIF4e n=1 Tax=Pseudomicrostroma glucosiphilum TaxID=1684307 RepID=A0A316UFD1_9BASI|nr:translation initiation factor eIF4e [Pseudomicrostroma glucosiphilum]PWN23121.1 translation initiation factor eIF4e [Pseudomicrostroma glucosiphilum]